MTQFDHVLQDVDKRCREEGIPMLGSKKAEFLAELVEIAQPSLIVECGTAIGYSGLWTASKLKAAGKGRIITTISPAFRRLNLVSRMVQLSSPIM